MEPTFGALKRAAQKKLADGLCYKLQTGPMNRVEADDLRNSLQVRPKRASISPRPDNHQKARYTDYGRLGRDANLF